MNDARCDLVYKAIRDFWDTNHYSPSIRDLSRMTGISSNSMVLLYLDHLEGEGKIERTPFKSRSIRPTGMDVRW